MPQKRGARAPSTAFPYHADPDDKVLIDRIRKGDDEALRKLMDRYDRLVRYTIFRTARRQCVRDPQWLDAVASESWTGLLQSLRRNPDGLRTSFVGFLTTVTRNQTISALRRIQRGAFIEMQPASAVESLEVPDVASDPGDLLSDIDSLQVLQKCLDQLPDADRVLFSQLDSITQRRWKDAAMVLGISESTLRSRWTRILGHLRECVEKKTGDVVAPDEARSDPVNRREDSPTRFRD